MLPLPPARFLTATCACPHTRRYSTSARATRNEEPGAVRPPDSYTAAFAAILRHSSAHRRQAVAQLWQWVSWNLPHSVAHESQIVAHRSHRAFAWALPRAMYCTASVQISAQSRSSWMQWVLEPTSGSCRQAVAQCSHSTAHFWHSSMHVLYSSCTSHHLPRSSISPRASGHSILEFPVLCRSRYLASIGIPPSGGEGHAEPHPDGRSEARASESAVQFLSGSILLLTHDP